MFEAVKYYLWVVVGIALSFLFVQSAAAADPMTIAFWHQLNYAERVVLAELIEEYEADHPNIRVTAIYRETEELRSAFQNSALAGTGPELVHGPSDQIGPFATMNIVRPMETLLSPEELDRLNPQALVWFQGEHDTTRHLYQVADRLGNHLTLIYNKKFIPEPPTTTDELIRIGQEQTVDINGDGKIDRFGLVWNFTEPYFFIPWLSGFGGWVMDEHYNPTLNTQANINALQFIIDLRDKYQITPANADYETAHNLFLEEMSAMIINGDWSWGTYIDNGINIGVTRLPLVSETGLWPGPMVSPRGYSINVNIEDEKLAPSLELLRFFLSDEAQLRMALATNITPTSKAVFDTPELQNNPIMQASLRQIEVCKPMPVAPELRAIWDAMRPFYQEALGGAATAEEAAYGMQKEAVRKISEMNEITRPAGYVIVMKILALLLIVAGLWYTRKSWAELAGDLRKRSFIYWMVLPAFVVMVLVVVYPFIYNIVLSVSNMGLRNFRSWEIVGLQNYAQVFLRTDFYSILFKTIVWTLVNIVFHVTLGVFLALLLNRVLPGKGAIRTLLILPWAVPQYITALTWRGMFNQEYGAINLILAKYLSMPMVNWLGSPLEAFAACIITNIWLGFPFMMIVALGGLQSIPYQLYEAADIDGGGWWTKLTKITLPLLKPVMTPAIVLGMVWTFNNINVIWLVSNAGEPSDKTHILVSFVYKSAFNLYRYSYAAAMSMVIFAILLTFGIFFIRKSRATEAVY